MPLSVQIWGPVRQQWSVAMENLLDNQMRYAQSRVEVALNYKEEPSACLEVRVYNDGPAIDEDSAGKDFRSLRQRQGRPIWPGSGHHPAGYGYARSQNQGK